MARPKTPALAVDIIIALTDRPGDPVVLIERRNPPHDGYALPGGFVDVGERLERAAIREAREETGLTVRLTALLGCYSDPHRDPRGHTVSVVYTAEATGTPRAMDDAKELDIYPPEHPPSPLTFDHALILQDYLRFRTRGELPPPRSEDHAGDRL